jgi:hypothetical protein
MSLNKSATKNAVDERKVRKELTFTQGKLSNLEKISVDPQIAALLTKVNGEITLSLTGKTCNVGITIEEKGGSTSNVTVDEFLRVLSAPGRIKSIAKQQQNLKDTERIRIILANYLFAFSTTVPEIRPITTETFGLIKQSFALASRVQTNREICEVLILKNPTDDLGRYLSVTLDLILQTVIGGIVSLIKGDKTVSESNSELLANYDVPIWSFNKFTKELINKETSPYLVFFPRKKGKGITATTRELSRASFHQVNSSVLVNSKALLGLVGDRVILDRMVSVTEHIADDDVAAEIFQKHPWNLIPPIEGDVDRLLEVKQKVIVEILPDAPKGDFKKKLAKLNNALLRTSLLENSGMKPDEVICKRFFPTSATDFNPANGVDIYEALRAESGISDAVENFYNPTTQAQSNMWAELLTLELKIPNSNQIRTAFAGYFQIADAPADRVVIVADLDPMINHRITRFASLNSSGFAKEGSPDLAAVLELKTRAFSVLERDENLKPDKKKNRPMALTRLSKGGSNLCDFFKKNFGNEASLTIRDLLCGFSSMRLQMEALQRISAASGQNLYQYIEEEEDGSDGDSDDDDEGVTFNW